MPCTTKSFNRLGWDAEETNILIFDRSSTHLLNDLASNFSVVHKVSYKLIVDSHCSILCVCRAMAEGDGGSFTAYNLSFEKLGIIATYS